MTVFRKICTGHPWSLRFHTSNSSTLPFWGNNFWGICRIHTRHILKISTTVDIKQKQHKDTYKKDITYPKDWEHFTLDKSFHNNKYNGLALQTCKVNNIIVIDIDNLEHWDQFLEEHDKDEPDTVKAISGSGGIHL